MRTCRRLGLILLFPAGLSHLDAGRVNERATLRVVPDVIEMGAFYSGAKVKVEGVAEKGARIIVTVVGADCDESFNTKGRKGPIWLNSGRIRISGIPSLFFRYSAEPVRAMMAGEEIGNLRLDEASLMRQMRVEPHSAGDSAVRAHYLELKRAQGNYRFVNDGVVMGPPGAQATPFSLEFVWPRRAAPATYEIQVYEVRDGAVIRRLTTPLRAVRVGFPAWISEMATRQPVEYGLAAVMIAALAGFGIDLFTTKVFGRKRVLRH